jgi:hypothetical protein
MTELTPEQQRNLDTTVGAVQRIAMHIVTLPKNQRAEQYAAVRRTFEESIRLEGGRHPREASAQCVVPHHGSGSHCDPVYFPE